MVRKLCGRRRRREKERKGDRERVGRVETGSAAPGRSIPYLLLPPFQLDTIVSLARCQTTRRLKKIKLVKERHIAFLAPVHHKTKISPCFFFFKLV